MIYSSRLKKILEYCLAQEDYVAVDTLAGLLKTSRRTIFRELQDVDEQLQPYGVRVRSKSRKGICIEGEYDKKQALLDELHTQGIQYIDKEERRNLLIFELLHSDELEKLIHYATMFQVSEATISNDLDAIEEWFSKHDITILRKPGLGIELSGSETMRRRAMTAIINETLQNSEDYRSIYYLDANLLLEQIFLRSDKESIMKLLNQSILERILQVFHQYQHELMLDRYAQTSYIGLIIHLVIAVDRILKHEELAENADVISMVETDASYETAKRMAQLLETEFDIDIPKVETAFIALHIKGAKISYIEHKDSEDEQEQQLHTLIKEMIDTYDEGIRYTLLQDDEFLQGLITHLEPTIIRLKNDLPIYNPLRDQLKSMYHDLFTQTQRACKRLEERYHCKVSEDEIGFITMHVGAALERSASKPTQRTVRVGVVCASGIGVSALLAARIAKAFPQGVDLITLSMDHILRQDYESCELLISTFSLDTSLPYLQVHILLSEEDITRISQQLDMVRVKPNVMISHGMKSFHEELRFLHDISEAALVLIDNIRLIDIDANAQPHDCIALAAQHMASNASSEEEIRQALRKREEMGSVIIKDYHFALFHAKCASCNIAQMLCMYPRDTTFQSEALKDMDFIIVLLMKEPHTKAAQELMSLLSRSVLEEDDFYQALRRRDEEALQDSLQMIIKRYIDTKEE